MIFERCGIPDVLLIRLDERRDERGMFARTMCRDEFAAAGIDADFVQQNMSITCMAGTVRGMHYQRTPHAEGKLVRCVRGAVLDVVVDVRPDSPTYLRHEAFRLDDLNRHQLYIPPGIAHGFQTFVDNTQMSYLMTESYAPEFAAGLRYDDPVLAIGWPEPVTTVADRDRAWPLAEPTVVPASAAHR